MPDHRVVDGSEQDAAPGVRQQAVEAARTEQGLGDQTGLPAHEQGPTPGPLDLFERGTAQLRRSGQRPRVVPDGCPPRDRRGPRSRSARTARCLRR